MNYDSNILYYIGIYKRTWKIIVFMVVISMVFAWCFSLVMPFNYISTVTVLPAGREETSASLLGKLQSDFSLNLIAYILRSKTMIEDIDKQFRLDEKLKFRYSMNVYAVRGGLAVEVKGSDPLLTEKIANFVIENLNKTNTRLDLTPNKQVVKILDPAAYGALQERQIPKRLLVNAGFAFLLTSFCIFFSDHLERLKS